MAIENNVEGKLKKDVGLLTALTLVVGMVLGAGAFMKPPAVLAAAGDSSTALLAWLVGAFLSMCGGLTLAELGVLYPRTGGIYVFLEEIYGKRVAYLYGWMMTFLYGPATVGALAGYFSSVFCFIFNIPENFTAVVAFTVMAFVVFVNSIGVRQAGYLQKIATFCKLIPVIALAVFGLIKGNGQVLGVSTGLGMAGPFSVAIIATLFAYDGWAQVASVAGEMKKPGRILPIAIIGGIIFLSLVYTAINIALFKVLPASQIVALGHDASSIAAQKLFGFYGGNIISVGIMISILGGLNGYVMTLSRITLAMGERNQLPGSAIFRRIEDDSRTPVNAQILLLVLSFVYFAIIDADRLSNISMFAIWAFYALCFFGVILTRRRHPDAPRSYKVPFYPVIPIIAMAGSLYIIYGMFAAQPWNALFALLLTALGLPVLYYCTGSKPFYQMISFRKRNAFLIASLIIVGMLFMSNRVFDNRPVLIVATENSNKPVAFESSTGEPTGFAIELINLLAEKSGYKVQYRPTVFENLFKAVNKKNADVAVGLLTITDERKQLVDFTASFGGSELALFVPANSPVKTLNDLIGKRIIVKSGTIAEQTIKSMGKFEILSLDNQPSILALINDGAIDATVDDQILLQKQLDDGVIKGRIISLGLKEDYGFAYNKENIELGNRLNSALTEIHKSGQLDQLYQKWQLDIKN